MPDFLNRIVSQLQINIRNLSVSQKVSLMVAVAAVMTVVMLAAVWSKKPDFQPVYSAATSESMTEVVSLLNEKGIPSKLSVDGMTLAVPSDKVPEARLAIAGEGVLSPGGAGFELFDGKQIGMTDFMQKLNYQRALQGELARTISQLSEVDNARVHIVMRKESLFEEQDEGGSASVVIGLKRGRGLSQSQINGITQLVANAVEGVEPGSVTVIDSRGNVLTRGGKGSVTEAMSSNHEVQRAFEREMEQKIAPMLEKAVGQGKSVVRVSAMLDFEQTEKVEEIFDPDGVVVRSEQRSEESASDAEGGGIPGVTTNLQEGGIGAAGGSNSNKSSETINYEITRVTKKTIAPQGTLKKLSVALLVDGTYQTNDKGERTYSPRSEDDLKIYENLVKKVVGFNADRGDQITVSSVPFEMVVTEVADEGFLAGKSDAFWISLARNISIALLGLIFFIFVLKPLVNWLVTPPEPGMFIEGAPRTVAEMEAALAGKERGASGKASVEDAKDDPEIVHSVVKGWLKE